MTPIWTLRFVIILGIVAVGLLIVDACLRAREAWRRRRQAQGGVYGVVLDRKGQVLGTYVDPMQTPRRASYVHMPGSVWTSANQDDAAAWAWEGQGATEEEARHAAQRLRLMYLNLLPELRPARRDEELSTPWSDGGGTLID